jgi:hypothetical protein
MSSPPSGSDPNFGQEGSPSGQPGWGPPQGRSGWGPPQGQSGWGPPQGQPPGYGPAPSYSGPPAGYGGPEAGRRPGAVTAAGVVGIVWGALALLVGLLALGVAFAVSGLFGLILLVTVVVGVGLLVGGIFVVTGRSPRILLYLSYAAIAINVIELIIALAQNSGSSTSGIVGFILPGVIVGLLLQQRSKQYYAARGMSY